MEEGESSASTSSPLTISEKLSFLLAVTPCAKIKWAFDTGYLSVVMRKIPTTRDSLPCFRDAVNNKFPHDTNDINIVNGVVSEFAQNEYGVQTQYIKVDGVFKPFTKNQYAFRMGEMFDPTTRFDRSEKTNETFRMKEPAVRRFGSEDLPFSQRAERTDSEAERPTTSFPLTKSDEVEPSTTPTTDETSRGTSPSTSVESESQEVESDGTSTPILNGWNDVITDWALMMDRNVMNA